MADDDNDIRAALRELVDEGGPAASEEALHEVLRRGRRKRAHKRVGAVAAVVVAVTGIGVATASLEGLGAGVGPPEPVTGAGQSTAPLTSSKPSTPRTTVTPTTSPESTSPARRTPPAACGTMTAVSPADEQDSEVGAGLRACEIPPDQHTPNFVAVLRSVWPNARVDELPRSRTYGVQAQVTSPEYTGYVGVEAYYYEGHPAAEHNNNAARPNEPLVLRGPGGLRNDVPGPEVRLYMPNGRLYLLYANQATTELDKVAKGLLGGAGG